MAYLYNKMEKYLTKYAWDSEDVQKTGLVSAHTKSPAQKLKWHIPQKCYKKEQSQGYDRRAMCFFC